MEKGCGKEDPTFLEIQTPMVPITSRIHSALNWMYKKMYDPSKYD